LLELKPHVSHNAAATRVKTHNTRECNGLLLERVEPRSSFMYCMHVWYAQLSSSHAYAVPAAVVTRTFKHTAVLLVPAISAAAIAASSVLMLQRAV
jgi:hypothetical protein